MWWEPTLNFRTMIGGFLLLFTAIIPYLHAKTTPELNTDTRLMHHLLDGYDNRVYGRRDTEPLMVNVGFTLIQLHSLDEKNQMLTSSGWFQVEWLDYRLQWNISEFNRTNIVIPSRELWLPDIGFLNSINLPRPVEDESNERDMESRNYLEFSLRSTQARLSASIYHTSMIKNEFRCVVYHDGSILWVPGGTYYTTCELDISKFPFDEQTCYLHLTNWAYNLGEMNLSSSTEVITMDSYNPSAEWAITDTKVYRSEVKYECCGDVSYPSLYFKLWIHRKSLYYIVNIIIPCIILSLLATFTFCVPPDSGEKISLGITLLLSFTVFQLIVAESIPRRSDSVPIISLYISVITGVVTLSIISAIVISQLHHRGAVKLPYYLRRFTFNFMARIMLMGDLTKKHGVQSASKWRNPDHSESPSSMSSRRAKIRLLNGVSPGTMDDSELKTLSSEQFSFRDGYSHKLLQTTNMHLEHIIETLKEYEIRRSDDESANYKKAEWQAVGKVYDRFFFIFFVINMIIITTYFLMPTSEMMAMKERAAP